VIRAEGVSVHFRDGLRRQLKALDGVDLEVKEGDFFALLGANGAGKSTAMYCFLGLIRPQRGRVTVMGEPPELGTALYERIAYLPEEAHYHGYLTVKEAAEFYSALYHHDNARRRAAEALERVGLLEFRDLKLDKCSKGMRQKLGIAQCLLNEPRLMLLDEPMRGLDPVAVKDFRDLLLDLNRRGVTIVMNSHLLAEVEMVANRAAILDHGRVLVQDEMSRLLNVDPGAYDVEVEGAAELPEYVRIDSHSGRSAVGRLPAERLDDFMDFMRGGSLSLVRCSRRKASLEESFLAILKGPARSA
jgi:ABC-2 type transport system ATP-binding protein